MGKRYFTDKDYERLIHFQMPKLLVYGEKYQKLSDSAKILYTVCLDLTKLSMENHGKPNKNGIIQNWKDENGYYIKLTVESIKAIMNCANSKAVKLKKELQEFELLEQKRMGLNKANLLYVLQLDYTEVDIYRVNQIHGDMLEVDEKTEEKPDEQRNSAFRNSGNQNSGILESGIQEFSKVESNNNKQTNNKLNNNKHIKNSIHEKINKLDVPQCVVDVLKEKTDRLNSDSIKLFEIELLFKAYRSELGNDKFASILYGVLENTKNRIGSIKAVLEKAIITYLENRKKFDVDRKPIRTEPTPDYMKYEKYDFSKQIDADLMTEEELQEQKVNEFLNGEKKKESKEDLETKKQALIERLAKYKNPSQQERIEGDN